MKSNNYICSCTALFDNVQLCDMGVVFLMILDSPFMFL